jgi:UDP-N-acetylmuramyl pentapeptide phosphotransferase/UDP-N-acetylglucosamine-1-phosphate transferase
MEAGVGNDLAWGAIVGALGLYGVGLVDDFRPLSTWFRFLVQFAVGLWILSVASGPLGALAAGKSGFLGGWLQPKDTVYWLAIVWFIGLINVFNFMDGIDGIAGLQAVVAGLTWAVIGDVLSLPTVRLFGLVVASAALGFLSLNWHPARIFMGDAGSTVLGFLFATLPFLASVEARGRLDLVRSLTVGCILVWPFLADGFFTFLRRLKNRENFFKAHRSHLYQRLVVAGHSHSLIAVVYGCLALLGAVLVIPLVKSPGTGAIGSPVPAALGVLAVAFVALWRWTLASEGQGRREARGERRGV